MKKTICSFSILFSLISFTAKSQAFWTETFGTGCNQGQLANAAAPTASNGAWSATSFSLPFMNGPNANEWFISAEEQAQAIGVCGGVTCGGVFNRSLHVGYNVLTPPPPIVDISADYLAGPGYNTNKRAESPVIDCSGHNFIQLSFTCLGQGVPGNDYCEIEYSPNGGTTWSPLVIIPAVSSTLCTLNGVWRTFAVALPSSAANNPNVKIGFHWYNNSSAGVDPSIAIDDMQLSELTMATSSTVNCVLASSSASIVNNAVGNTSYTWSAIPNTVTFTPINSPTTNIQYPALGTYTIMANGSYSLNGAATSTAMSIANVVFGSTPMVSAVTTDSLLCSGSSATLTGNGANSYTWSSGPTTSTYVVSPTANTIYTVTGGNGHCISTYTIQQQVDPCTGLSAIALTEKETFHIFPNPFSSEINLTSNEEVEISLLNTLGQIVKQIKFKDHATLQTSELPNGIYLLLMKVDGHLKTSRVVKN